MCGNLVFACQKGRISGHFISGRSLIFTIIFTPLLRCSQGKQEYHVQEDVGEPTELDDEINNLLLKHERSNRQQQAVVTGGGDDSDSDQR